MKNRKVHKEMKIQEKCEKVFTQNIHTWKFKKDDKMDLYTDLSTLSTAIHKI